MSQEPRSASPGLPQSGPLLGLAQGVRGAEEVGVGIVIRKYIKLRPKIYVGGVFAIFEIR